ncbi:dUTP diphosphatase [Trichoderma sp. SZMC 28014]
MSSAPEVNGTASPPAKRIKTLPVDGDAEQDQNSSAAPQEETPANPTTTTSATATVMEASIPLQVKKLSPQGRLPTRGSAFAAGYDVYAARDTIVPARGKVLVDTDISIAVPAGTYGRIAPRSGLASKHFIDTGAGVIDADYRGPVKVLLFNHADADYEIKEGDRVAQLVLERIVTPDVVEVEELEESVRGAGGFGSTGKN